jgi:uncharacterized membrane protein
LPKGRVYCHTNFQYRRTKGQLDPKIRENGAELRYLPALSLKLQPGQKYSKGSGVSRENPSPGKQDQTKKHFIRGLKITLLLTAPI